MPSHHIALFRGTDGQEKVSYAWLQATEKTKLKRAAWQKVRNRGEDVSAEGQYLVSGSVSCKHTHSISLSLYLFLPYVIFISSLHECAQKKAILVVANSWGAGVRGERGTGLSTARTEELLSEASESAASENVIHTKFVFELFLGVTQRVEGVKLNNNRGTFISKVNALSLPLTFVSRSRRIHLWFIGSVDIISPCVITAVSICWNDSFLEVACILLTVGTADKNSRCLVSL